MQKLTKRECLDAVERGDFDPSVTGSAEAVAIVLTQSWCVQWVWMRSYLEQLEEEPGRRIFWIEYDNEDFYERFLAFKEEVYGNREIPYVRFYREGRLVRETNFIDKSGFLKALAAPG